MTDTALVPQGTNEITSQFGTSSGFELLQRQAQMLANSSMVPEQFSIFDKGGKVKPADQQKYAVANAIIALEISHRIGASPLMVAQNLVVIYGRPTWSSQFVIAAINASGRFSALRFDISGAGDEKSCVAWVLDRKTGDRLEGPPVSIGMAKKEGWYGKNGSKWQTLPELMLRYRAAAFFGRLYAPDLLMGMRSVDEAYDLGDDVIDVEATPSTVADINAEIKASKAARKAEKAEQIPPTVSSKPEPEPVAEPQKDDKTGDIPPQIMRELEDIDAKTSEAAINQWLMKHYKRCSKLHGETWWKFITEHAEKNLALLNAGPAPGDESPSVVVSEAEDIPMVKCPEAGGREILRSDCDLGECRHMCPAYNSSVNSPE